MQGDYCKTNKLSILDKRIKPFQEGYRQNVALLGNDAQEISCLLENYFKNNKSHALIHLHTSAKYADPRSFLKNISYALLSEYLGRADGLDSLITQAQVSLPQTINHITQTLRKNNITFIDALEVINKFIAESNKKVVLIIEEFLELENIFSNCFKELSKFIILQRECMTVLTSSYPRKSQKIFAADLNLLFGNFEQIMLSEASFVNSFLCLKSLIQPQKPSTLFLSFLVNISGNNHRHYELISESVKKHYPNRKHNEEATLIAILEDLLYSTHSPLFVEFTKRVDCLQVKYKEFSIILDVLLAISQGYLRKKELLGLNLTNTKAVESALNKLLDCNYITAFGNIYKISDPLFSFWLSKVFKLYFRPHCCDSSKRKSLWRKQMQEEIALFKEDFMKDKMKRVLELIASFKNDTLQLGKDRYRLPQIQKTRVVSYPDRDLSYLVGEGDELIFVGIKEQNAQDNDLYEFIEAGKNVKGKRIKKIFISLEELAPTAKLIAKNHKLIAWDSNEINQLLSMYNKPTLAPDKIWIKDENTGSR